MMEYQNLERVNFIKTLSTLIESATSLADGVLHDLGWTREKILDDGKDLAHCSVDHSHTVKPAELEEHIKGCQLKDVGFDNVSTKDLPDSSAFFYHSPSSTATQVILDKSQLESLGLKLKRPDVKQNNKPQRNPLHKQDMYEQRNLKSGEDSEQIMFQLPAKYLETMLSVDDRLKLYEYVLQKSKTLQKAQAITYDELEQEANEQQKVLEMQNREETDRPKSKVEAMAELRDYKRRRQSYRAKTITQSKRPAVEVIRELIDQQMKYLEIISGKRVDRDEVVGDEEEQNADHLSESLNESEDARQSKRHLCEGDASERYDDEGERKDRSKHRYGIREMSDWRRRDQSVERRRDRGERRDTRRKSDRDRGSRRDRSRDRDRDQERRRYRDRSRGDRKDRSMDGKREGYRQGGRSSDRENCARNKREEDVEDSRYESVTGGRRTEDRYDMENMSGKEIKLYESMTSEFVREGGFEIEEMLKDIRSGLEKDGKDLQKKDVANEDVSREFHVVDVEKGRREKRRRSRSNSGSITGSRSGSKERQKDKRHKHKKKKKKMKKRKESLDDESEDEWIERE